MDIESFNDEPDVAHNAFGRIAVASEEHSRTNESYRDEYTLLIPNPDHYEQPFFTTTQPLPLRQFIDNLISIYVQTFLQCAKCNLTAKPIQGKFSRI